MFASADGGATWTPLRIVGGGYTNAPYTTTRNCFGFGTTNVAFTSPIGSLAPAVDAWTLAEYDLTPFMGASVQLRWMFGSDASVVKRGWYFDDVLIQVGFGALATVPVPIVSGTQVPFTPLLTSYAEDFEGGDGGWTSTGGVWEHGSPSSPPVTLPGSLNVWGTNLEGNYAPDACGYLTSGPITLPAASASAGVEVARLGLKMWKQMEAGYDAAVLQVSTNNGATWTRLVPHEGVYDRTLTASAAASTRACLGISTTDLAWSGPSTAPKDDEWFNVAADVSAYLGSTVQFRLAFGSEATGEYRGVYVDDVVVQVGTGANVGVPDPNAPFRSLSAPGWTVTGTNPSWAWGFPGSATETPVWDTNLEGDYNANECSAIVSPPIDTRAVPGVGRLTMGFVHKMDTASTDDGGVVQVTKNGGATWTTVIPVGGYPSTLGTASKACTGTTSGYAKDFPWTSADFRLDAFQGETIQVRLVFGSGASTNAPGWTMKELRLSRGAAFVPLGASALVAPEVLEKADPALRMALEAGHGLDLPVIVLGKAHENVAAQQLPTREAWNAWFNTQATPFLAGVKRTVEFSGGEVVATWPVTPAAKVVVDLPTLNLLGSRDDVEMLTLDYDGAVKLIEPEPSTDLGVQNTQGRKQLEAEEIWALGYRGEGMRVVIIDTGIDGSHEAFKHADGSSRIVGWFDAVNNRPAPYDDHGHGTHVAGTSMGSSDYVDPNFGAFQETGVAPKATILGAKFLSSTGSGSFQGAIDSLTWSFNQNADITSNSWGASGCSSSAHAVMRTVRTLTDAGMLSVFAAGNSGPSSGTIGSPGCSEAALTVGAIDNNLAIASFSSRGPCSDTEIGGASRVCPDVVAKGVAVRSAIPRSGAASGDPSGYKTWQGTSMATPHIAGAVALAEQMKRQLTGSGWDTAARAEEQVFKLTAMDLGAAGEDSTFGWGLPKLLSIYALLSATDEANVVGAFGVSKTAVRQGDSTTLSFSVRNLGGAPATGTFLATLTAPDGAVTTLKSSTRTLALLDGESSTTVFTVTGNALPGTYTFRGVFDYTWTNGTTGETVTGSFVREGTFDVKRVFVKVTLEGLDANTLPGSLQTVVFTAENTGNEDASGVVLEFTVADDYVFVPGANFDPANPNTRYADPAPTSVKEDRNFGRVTLVYNVGTLPQGASFSFTTNLLPTLPGEYRFLTVAKFKDGGGNGFSQGSSVTQTVGLPSVA